MRNFLISAIILHTTTLHAQEDTKACKVLMDNLSGEYKGDCSKGLANGQGEAKGIFHYTGNFKNGMPNGTGTFYYSDSNFYSGNFQDGVKEGKGEMHYIRTARPDSVVKGYWSGDEFRGKRYTTYSFDVGGSFDRVEIIPSQESGRAVSFEISTTSGMPGNVTLGGSGLTLVQLYSENSAILKFTSKFESSNTSYVTYEMYKFPAILKGTLSNGITFELHLYKAANWKVRLYKNI